MWNQNRSMLGAMVQFDITPGTWSERYTEYQDTDLLKG